MKQIFCYYGNQTTLMFQEILKNEKSFLFRPEVYFEPNLTSFSEIPISTLKKDDSIFSFLPPNLTTISSVFVMDSIWLEEKQVRELYFLSSDFGIPVYFFGLQKDHSTLVSQKILSFANKVIKEVNVPYLDSKRESFQSFYGYKSKYLMPIFCKMMKEVGMGEYHWHEIEQVNNKNVYETSLSYLLFLLRDEISLEDIKEKNKLRNERNIQEFLNQEEEGIVKISYRYFVMRESFNPFLHEYQKERPCIPTYIDFQNRSESVLQQYQGHCGDTERNCISRKYYYLLDFMEFVNEWRMNNNWVTFTPYYEDKLYQEIDHLVDPFFKKYPFIRSKKLDSVSR